jgi:hypothetical protein
MFVLCLFVTMVCCWLIDNTFHNFYLTMGLSCAMALTSGFLVAVDERRQRDTDDSVEPRS